MHKFTVSLVKRNGDFHSVRNATVSTLAQTVKAQASASNEEIRVSRYSDSILNSLDPDRILYLSQYECIEELVADMLEK